MRLQFTINTSLLHVIAICFGLVVSAFGGAIGIVYGIGELWLDSMDRHIEDVGRRVDTAMQQNLATSQALGGARADLVQKISETREIVAANGVKIDDLREQVRNIASDTKQIDARLVAVLEKMPRR